MRTEKCNHKESKKTNQREEGRKNVNSKKSLNQKIAKRNKQEQVIVMITNNRWITSYQRKGDRSKKNLKMRRSLFERINDSVDCNPRQRTEEEALGSPSCHAKNDRL